MKRDGGVREGGMGRGRIGEQWYVGGIEYTMEGGWLVGWEEDMGEGY